MFERKIAVISVVLYACASYVGTYPTGAPQDTCHDMVPRHGDLVPQRDSPPFMVSPSVLSVTSGSKMKLMLNSLEGLSFAGFMLQARSPANPEQPIGTFVNLPDMAKTLTCGNGIKDTATHKNRSLKKALEFEWEPPADYEGPVVFNATFVKDGATFWVGVQSEDVQVKKRSIDDAERPQVGISTTKNPIRLTTVPNYTLEPETKAARQTSPIYDGCGVTKTCFGDIDGCENSKSCTFMTSVLAKGDVYTFELLATPTDNKPNYAAVALSKDTGMGADSVMECILRDGKIDVFMSWNLANDKDNEGSIDELKNSVQLIKASVDDGAIYCSFTRDTVTNVKGTEFNLATDAYFLLIASGASLHDNGVGYHDIGKRSTGKAIQLSEVTVLSGKSDILYRLHGAFMIAAWIGSASVGMLLARYFKKTWVGSQLCGKDQWFAWHRIFMVSTWTLTCVGFILIFVEIKDWYSQTSNPHAILGCITTGLAFIQPFGAALRPMPDSPKRPIFNWLHWLVGNCAHILAVVTIFFAVKLAKAQLPEWTDWVLVSFVGFHVFMHLVYSIIHCLSDRAWDQKVNDFPMKDMSSSRSPLHGMDRKRDSPHSCLRKFLLAIYLIIIIALTVFLIVMVALAPIEEHWAFKEAKKLILNQ